MAKRIVGGEVATKITADGLQLTTEAAKCEKAIDSLARKTRSGGEGIAASLEHAFSKGTLGKLEHGFLRVAASVGTAWEAFRAGQEIRAQVEDFLKSGAKLAEEFSDALTNSALEPASALKDTNKRIDELNAKLAFKAEHPILGLGLDAKKMQDELADLNKKAGAYKKTLDAIEKAKIARQDRGRLAKATDAALEVTAPLFERKRFADEAIFQRKMKRLEEQAAEETNQAVREKLEERIRSERALHEREKKKTEKRDLEDLAAANQDMNAKLLRDEEEIIKHKASIEKDFGKKRALEAQARALEIKAIEIDSALEISAIRRKIEDTDDAAGRKILQKDIELAKQRKDIAIKALEPDKPKIVERDLEAIRKGSAEEARLRFTAGRTRADDTGKRQLEAQKDANKLLRDIKKNTTPTNTEIMLL
jgi:hypothetical protein